MAFEIWGSSVDNASKSDERGEQGRKESKREWEARVEGEGKGGKEREKKIISCCIIPAQTVIKEHTHTQHTHKSIGSFCIALTKKITSENKGGRIHFDSSFQRLSAHSCWLHVLGQNVLLKPATQ